MAQHSLQLETWKVLKPDERSSLRVAFRFRLRPEEVDPGAAGQGSGRSPGEGSDPRIRHATQADRGNAAEGPRPRLPRPRRGLRPGSGSGAVFWTEVRLSRDLAERTGWRDLDRESWIKVLYLHAVDRIVEEGRAVREAPLFWRAGAPRGSAPPPYLEKVPFLPAAPVIFEHGGVAADSSSSSRLARTAAGLA